MQDGFRAAKIKALINAQPKGHALLRDFYKDPDIYEAEMQTLFGRHWLLAGHVSQIPQVGDYFLVEFDTESVIVARTGPTDFSAQMNVCRHRGSRICQEKSGHAKSFTCPYHAWTYDLAGNLIAAGQMGADFDKTDYGLRAVKIENIHGFLLISLANTPPSLAPMKDALKDILPIFETESLQLAEMKPYEVAANWKLAVENYQECYHCAPAHKEFAKIHAMARDLPRFKALKSDYEKTMPSGGIMSERNAYFHLAEPGAEGFQYSRNPLLENCKTGSKDGTPLAPLLGQIETYTGGASELMLGPFSYFLIYDDHMVGYRFRPTDIDHCVCDVYWFVRAGARAGQDFDLAQLIWLWDVTTKADQIIIRQNQAGVNSRYYKPGPLSQMEHFQQSFLSWYLAALGG